MSEVKKKRTRVDAKINKAKVAKEILNNPLQSEREIAKKTWLGNSTVHEHKKELKSSKDERIVWICDTDIEIVKLWQKEIYRRLWKAEELEKMKTWEISQTIRENTARYTIFKWDITDEEWWMKNNASDMSTEELLRLINDK